MAQKEIELGLSASGVLRNGHYYPRDLPAMGRQRARCFSRTWSAFRCDGPSVGRKNWTFRFTGLPPVHEADLAGRPRVERTHFETCFRECTHFSACHLVTSQSRATQIWPDSSRQGIKLSGPRFFEISPSIGIVGDIPASDRASHQLTIVPDARSKRLSCHLHLMSPFSSMRLADLIGTVAVDV